MKPEIKAWIEKITERAAIMFEAEEHDTKLLRGMFYCSQVGWDVKKIKKMVGFLKEYGLAEEDIQDIRNAYSMWRTK